jgi:hypothetical protein
MVLIRRDCGCIMRMCVLKNSGDYFSIMALKEIGWTKQLALQVQLFKSFRSSGLLIWDDGLLF